MCMLVRKITSLQPTLAHSFKHRRLRSQRVAMQSSLKCSNPWIEELVGWIVCVKLPGVLEKHQMFGKLSWSSLYTKKWKGWNTLTTGTPLSLALLETCMPSALKKEWCEIVEPELDDTKCSFCPGSSIRDQIFTLEHNFVNLVSM